MKKNLSTKEFLKLHDDLINQTLVYSDALINQGVKSVSWTLKNNTRVTIKNSKKAFKKIIKGRIK